MRSSREKEHMPKIPTLIELLEAGAHFGHKTSKWHPRMKKFLFGERQGIHIINLEETQKALQTAMEFAKTTAARGGTILFVGTKKQSTPIVEEAAKKCGMPYVSKRWLGGTLTNFASISSQVRKYKDLKRKQEKGELAKYTKLEQLKMAEQLDIMEEKVGGMLEMNRIPEAIFILDIKKDKTALQEAVRRGVKVIAICDSNVNPKNVDYPIPANDDAIKSIELLTNVMADAMKEGREDWEKKRGALGGSLMTKGAVKTKA